MKLTLSNFQIHQKPTTLEIPEGETTYVEGESDIGKSSRLRAMRWLCENKPDGGSFVTFKQPRGTTSVVTLEIDGRSVTRERGKSKNLYAMDGETYEAFGRSVPEPIAAFLNLSPYAFQLQGETPFLIGASATDAAKILSEACGLGVIDTAVTFVRQKKVVAEAEIRKAEILLESAQQRLSQATESLPLADALEAAARAGDDVEELSTNVDMLREAIDEEPEGELLEVEPLRDAAYLAHQAWEAMFNLTSRAGALRWTINQEPLGTPHPIEPVRPVYYTLLLIVPALAGLHDNAAKLRNAIAAEPVAVAFDLEAVKALVGQTRVLVEWLKSVTESRDRMRYLLSIEPTGEPRDLTGIAEAVAKARATAEERKMLSDMCLRMIVAIKTEPFGNLIDTTELQQLRTQIKVCPQCGREL